VGYSCTAKASLVLAAIQSVMDKAMPDDKSSNKLPNGFWERGREQPDGAITGTVFKTVRILSDAERAEAAAKMGGGAQPDWIGNPCVRAGSFKISADGKIVRFPQLTKAQRKMAEMAGNVAFTERYESNATVQYRSNV
jgi:hypothetical protein